MITPKMKVSVFQVIWAFQAKFLKFKALLANLQWTSIFIHNVSIHSMEHIITK